MPPRLPVTGALSIVDSAKETMCDLFEEEQALKYPIDQLRRGATLPPMVVLELLEQHQRSCASQRAHTHLVTALICEAAAPLTRPPDPPDPGYWRNLWNAVRGR